jgi:hypothetical protein
VSTYETVFGDEPAQTGVDYWGYYAEAGRFRYELDTFTRTDG